MNNLDNDGFTSEDAVSFFSKVDKEEGSSSRIAEATAKILDIDPAVITESDTSHGESHAIDTEKSAEQCTAEYMVKIAKKKLVEELALKLVKESEVYKEQEAKIAFLEADVNVGDFDPVMTDALFELDQIEKDEKWKDQAEKAIDEKITGLSLAEQYKLLKDGSSLQNLPTTETVAEDDKGKVDFTLEIKDETADDELLVVDLKESDIAEGDEILTVTYEDINAVAEEAKKTNIVITEDDMKAHEAAQAWFDKMNRGGFQKFMDNVRNIFSGFSSR